MILHDSAARPEASGTHCRAFSDCFAKTAAPHFHLLERQATKKHVNVGKYMLKMCRMSAQPLWKIKGPRL